MPVAFRLEEPRDIEAIRRVNRLAFNQDDEARLVDELRAGGYSRISVVAERDGELAGAPGKVLTQVRRNRQDTSCRVSSQRSEWA